MSGDGPTAAPLTQRPTKRVQSAGSSTTTRSRSAIGRVRLRDLHDRVAERSAGGRGHLARQADEAQGIAAVRLHVHVEDDVAVQVGEVHAERGLRRAG